jgi:ribose transport system ATP-binding protein
MVGAMVEDQVGAAAGTEQEPLLAAAGLCKSYGPVRALTDADFDLRRGEVHALVGENGAGKSTLARIFAGLTPPDSGSLAFRGRPYLPRDRRHAEQHGVRIVMQELNLIGTLTVAESLFVDRLPHRWGWIDYGSLHEQARTALARVGMVHLDPRRHVRTLGVGQQQLIEIAAGLARRCDVLILDEPTAALTGPEVDRLFTQIDALKAAGTGVIYISHRLEEITRIADRVSVLRDGRMVATFPAARVTLDEVVRLMVGRDLGRIGEREARKAGPDALDVRELRREPAVRRVSFTLRRGQILGFAGLMGSGRTETMRAVFGADRADSGEIRMHGSGRPLAIRSPRDAVRHGIALLTENRKEQGLLLPLAIRSNMTLPSLRRFSTGVGWLLRHAESREAATWITTLGIRCRDAGQRVGDLSGGNQQKVVIAKWLLRDCDVFIFDEPTRGIDVGARFEVHRLLGELADRGKAIAVVSSDLPELMTLCDRIVVMSAGRIAATFSRGEWTEEGIMAAALSGYVKEATA